MLILYNDQLSVRLPLCLHTSEGASSPSITEGADTCTVEEVKPQG